MIALPHLSINRPDWRPAGLAAGLILSLPLLSACSNIPFIGSQSEAQRAEEAADRAGRVAMVLGEDEIEADPELADQTIDLPPAEPSVDWPQAGATAAKVVGHLQGVERLRIAWRSDAGRGSDNKSALTCAPVAADGVIYTLDAAQTVRAFDAASGNRIWSREIDSGNRRDRIGIGGCLGLSDGRLIVTSGYSLVLALDAQSGDELWRRDMDAPMTGAPTFKDGRVFVTSNNNEVFAMDEATGQTEWSDQAIAEPARVLGSSSPAAVEDIVVVPYSSGEVIAYLASNGRRLWTDALSRPGRFTPISAINDIAARPVLAGGLVFAANQSGVTAAIDGRTGNRVWVQPIGSTQAPALVGDVLFMSSTDGKLAALQADTGRVYWVTDLPRFRKPDDQKGRISYTGPLVVSERVMILSSEGDLLVFDAQTGAQTDTLEVADEVFLEPILVDGKLIVLTDDARLVAVE